MFYDLNLSILEILQSFGCISLLTLGIIYIIRWKLFLSSKKDLKTKSTTNTGLNTARSRTKYPEVDAFKYSNTLFNYGLFIALAFSFTVISWTSYKKAVYTLVEPVEIEDIEIVPPVTSFRKPLPPPPPPIIDALIDVSVEEEYKLELMEEDIIESNENNNNDSIVSVENFSNSLIDIAPKMELPKEQDLPPDIINFAEEMPRFPGCENELLKKDKIACSQKRMLDYIYSHLKYPAIARQNKIEGVCVISFVVSKTGAITDIELIRDIGASCGKNSLKTIQQMSLLEEKWIPGKQRGQPVNVRYKLPIKFKLSN